VPYLIFSVSLETPPQRRRYKRGGEDPQTYLARIREERRESGGFRKRRKKKRRKKIAVLYLSQQKKTTPQSHERLGKKGKGLVPTTPPKNRQSKRRNATSRKRGTKGGIESGVFFVPERRENKKLKPRQLERGDSPSSMAGKRKKKAP